MNNTDKNNKNTEEQMNQGGDRKGGKAGMENRNRDESDARKNNQESGRDGGKPTNNS